MNSTTDREWERVLEAREFEFIGMQLGRGAVERFHGLQGCSDASSAWIELDHWTKRFWEEFHH